VQNVPAERPPAPNTSSTLLHSQAGAAVYSTADTSLRLATGDLLDISVYNIPELSTKARVSNNGDVYLPLIDYVHVAGLTTEGAQALIEKRFSDGGFLKDPHVALVIADSPTQGASVLGEIARPGIYPVLPDQRLFGLISSAGGFTEKAGRNVIITHRGQPDKPLTLALSRNITSNPESNVEVSPGDTVIVSKADIVYVVGDVGKPSGFLMDVENLTVLKAIALAGGTNRTAKLNGTTIIRKGPNGMTETPVHLKKILQAKSQDIPMQAEDILFVPTSSGRVFAARSFEAAMSAATAVSIVAVHP
jgi:polysaccharide export outer membrane protein